MSSLSGNIVPAMSQNRSTPGPINGRPSTEMSSLSMTVVDNDTERSSSARPQSRRQQSIVSLPQETQDQIHELARRLTSASMISNHGQKTQNPFFGTSDPALDPNSNSFEFEAWLDKLVDKQKAERTPTPNAGISFRNLSVHGFGSPTDYQKDFANVFLEGLGMIQKMMGKGQTRIQILDRFDGLVKEGEMLVVLGRPGSGCSTLLKTIAGVPKEQMYKSFRGEIIYNAETEIHFPNLTVSETLSFAAKARVPRNRPHGVSRKVYAEHWRDVALALFGLRHTVNTKVGNDFIRGVSGGERKRVSIAEAFLAHCTLQCWDNSTRGLDSATALEFVKTLRTASTIAGTTVVFDKVTLLYEGRQIFFGRTDQAKIYFERLGFFCPDRQTTADFLTSITSPSERIVRAGCEHMVPRSPDEFAEAWKKSDERMELLSEIHAFEQEFQLGGPQLNLFKEARKDRQAKHTRPGSPYTISIAMQIGLCITRGFQRLRGDMSLFWTSVLGNWMMALIISSVFYNLPSNTSSFYSRGALLFFATLLNAMSSAIEVCLPGARLKIMLLIPRIVQILTLYAQRPIVEKHTKYAFYHPSAEAFASMVCDLPAKILTATAFNLTLYFMANLRREPGAFFIFFLFCFSTTLTMSMIFRTIASMSRTLSQAMVPASLFILALTIYAGFAIPTRDMHVYFRWINYINPVAYAFESLMVNEFHGRQFLCSTFVPQGPAYGNATGLERICSTVGAVAGSAVVDGGQLIRDRNFGIIIAFMFFFLGTYLIGTEYISAARSKGEILVFKRGHVPKIASSRDEEAAPIPEVQRVVAEISGSESEKNVSAKNEQNGVPETIQKQTAVFHWKDVCYDIKIKGNPRRLLDHVDGWIRPGTLTALVGASGAGKTTLLDVLASRVTMGIVTGQMLVDGHQRDYSFQRRTGYVMQQDLHLETSTVREALLFSALLRQPAHVSKEDKVKYVDEVIKLLEIEEYSDAVVGVPGEGLNVEQRKRLTIGVELAAKPQLLLFLDEPTSGLDSQTAFSICSLLRKLADNGQAILCTIHQPSAILFQSFDRILLLAAGGKTIYFGDIGPNSQTVTKYFQSKSGVGCPPEANPAEWILEQIGAAPGHHSLYDWAQLWIDSEERSQLRSQLDEMKETLSKKPVQPDTHQTTFATSFWYQTYWVTRRCFEQYWRTPTYLYSKCALCIFPSLFIGFSFFKAENSIQGLQNQMFAVFMIFTVFGNLVQQIMPQFVTQRALFEARERQSKSHSWQAFLVANIVVELPWNALMAVLMYMCWYYPIGLYRNAEPTDAVHERGALMFLFALSFLLFTSTFTNMVIAAIEVAETGGMVANLMFSLTLIFCGVLASPNTMPHFWIFMYRVSPFTYLVSGMLSTGLADQKVICSSIEVLSFDPPINQTCGSYMADYMSLAGGVVYNPEATAGCQFCSVTNTNVYLSALGASYSEAWRNFGLMWVYIIFNIFGAVALYWLVRVPKKWSISGGLRWVQKRLAQTGTSRK
ncbi:probable ABC transporter [Phialocephala subalpina]|uniref:Probable ABC transporter n=1 Tax=Phialocephala subalpina TaxID=576137 RepID=A0A1L7XRG0_9HELO|nr:probable ABC transporter [Phialocephala subalpina]